MTYFSKVAPKLLTLTLTSLCSLGTVQANTPVWTFTPLTNTYITVDSNSTATIQYTVTNQSSRSHTLTMTNIPGISQTTTAGNCNNPFTLGYQESCTLTLLITGRALTGNIIGGPKVCQQGGGTLQCYEPSPAARLHITRSSTPQTLNIGDHFGGGTVACLTSEGGEANLIAATVDNSNTIEWGGAGTPSTAVSNTNGTENTATIVNCLTNSSGCTAPLNPPIALNTYAAGICASYTNDGFSDWFLPAKDQLNCLYTNQAAIGGFTANRYWSSTELDQSAPVFAWNQDFFDGIQHVNSKRNIFRIRCVRAFTP